MKQLWTIIRGLIVIFAVGYFLFMCFGCGTLNKICNNQKFFSQVICKDSTCATVYIPYCDTLFINSKKPK